MANGDGDAWLQLLALHDATLFSPYTVATTTRGESEVPGRQVTDRKKRKKKGPQHIS